MIETRRHAEWADESYKCKSLEILRRAKPEKGCTTIIDGSWGFKKLVQLQIGDVDTTNKRRHWQGEDANRCLCCDTIMEETVQHLLTECTAVNKARQTVQSYFEEERESEPESDNDFQEERRLLGLKGNISSDGWTARRGTKRLALKEDRNNVQRFQGSITVHRLYSTLQMYIEERSN